MRAGKVFLAVCLFVFVAGLASAQPSQVAEVQQQLNTLGFDAGPIDGAMGPKTRRAIGAFQREHALLPTNELTPETLEALKEAFARQSTQPVAPANAMPRTPPPPSKSTSSSSGSGFWWIIAGAVLVFYWIRRRKAKSRKQELEASFGRMTPSRDYNVSIRTERVRSEHPSLVVKFVVDDDFSPPQRQRRTGKTDWIPAGSSKQVAGFEVGGMVYVGNPQCATVHWRDENCVIDPSAKVSTSQADHTGGRMPYWPCYAEIDPACRRAYLEWLAGGRKRPRHVYRIRLLVFLRPRATFDRGCAGRRGSTGTLCRGRAVARDLWRQWFLQSVFESAARLPTGLDQGSRGD